ncbi:MAG: 16S rRNA (guanine(527)-N(7))-methyltransferase RsmG [Nitrospirae bacterium]|nr:16S rRNA (guanine(527)-N(7))-methyltransferase RsmG [Nitrospirota bacterium]
MNPKELLDNGALEIGFPCSKKEISSFMTFLSELKKWNKTYNLTALKTDNDIIIKHFLDSILYLKAFPDGCLKIADAGSGAGFPGIPIKIIRPDINVTLIESSRKKATFLRHIVRLLKLTEISVVEERIENLGDEYKKSFDIVVSRATFKIKDFVETARPFIKENGLLVLSKGPMLKEELDEMPYNGCHVESILNLQLPFIKDERNLIVVKCE